MILAGLYLIPSIVAALIYGRRYQLRTKREG